MSTQELIDRLRENGITVTTDNGNLKIRADNPEAVKPFLPELKQKKPDIIAYLNETEREMQAEIALFHGEVVALSPGTYAHSTAKRTGSHKARQ